MTTKSIAHQIEERKRRGAALLAADASNVAQVSHTLYLVRGSESADYKVVLTDTPSCECQDFQRHGKTLGCCKHIEAVKLFNRVYDLIEALGDDLATVQAVAGAASGGQMRRLGWEAVLSAVRYRAGIRTPAAVLAFPIARRVAEMGRAA